eukprot:713284_1
MELNAAIFDDIPWNVKATERKHKICTSPTTTCININCKQSNAKKGMAINETIRNKIYMAHQVILSPTHRFCGQCMDTAINEVSKLKFKFKSVSYPSFAPLDSLLSSMVCNG